MKTTTRLLAVLGFLTLGATATRAVESGPYSMEILIGGSPLREYAARGTTYIEAQRKREYAVRLTNNTGERVAVALAVDGLNSIDARRTSALDGRKWILGPFESVTLEGWQTSGSTARRFFFTTEKSSYGAWLGRTDDLGIVSAVFFREKRPVYRAQREIDARGDSAAAGAPAPSAPAARDTEAKKEKSVLQENAATGIGEEIRNPVYTVAFEEQSNPAASLRIRYEFRDALVRLGVVPPPRPSCDDALARRERANGFDDQRFAPDPYRSR